MSPGVVGGLRCGAARCGVLGQGPGLSPGLTTILQSWPGAKGSAVGVPSNCSSFSRLVKLLFHASTNALWAAVAPLATNWGRYQAATCSEIQISNFLTTWWRVKKPKGFEQMKIHSFKVSPRPKPLTQQRVREIANRNTHFSLFCQIVFALLTSTCGTQTY